MTTWTNDDLRRQCAYYGFTDCPLTGSQLDTLRAGGVDLDGAYAIACDMAAGFPLKVTP